jgi:signal transduction histidine kinase
MLRLGLRGRLIAGSVGLVIGFLALACGVLHALIARYAEEQISLELIGAQSSFDSHARLGRAARRQRAEFLASSAVLKALLSTNDRKTIEEELPSIARLNAGEILLLYGPDGQLLALAGTRDWPREAENGPVGGFGEDTDLLLDVGGRGHLAALVAVRERELVVASLVLGRVIDDELAREISAATSQDVVLLHRGRVVGTARQRPEQGELLPPDDAEAARELATRAPGSAVAVRLGGTERKALLARLHPGGGALLLSRDPGQIISLRRGALGLLLSVAAVIGAIGVLACLRVAQRLSGPLLTLTHATEGLASGDHSVRVEERGHDEVARLGRAFNQMAKTIGCLVADVREQAARAEAANRAKDGFLSTVSHELRTPATNVRAHAEILGHYGEELPPIERTQMLDVILSESDRLESLISKLLEFCELEAGTKVWRREATDLGELVAGAREGFRAAAARRRVRIEVEGEARVPMLGDPGRARPHVGEPDRECDPLLARGWRRVDRARDARAVARARRARPRARCAGCRQGQGVRALLSAWRRADAAVAGARARVGVRAHDREGARGDVPVRGRARRRGAVSSSSCRPETAPPRRHSMRRRAWRRPELGSVGRLTAALARRRATALHAGRAGTIPIVAPRARRGARLISRAPAANEPPCMTVLCRAWSPSARRFAGGIARRARKLAG